MRNKKAKNSEKLRKVHRFLRSEEKDEAKNYVDPLEPAPPVSKTVLPINAPQMLKKLGAKKDFHDKNDVENPQKWNNSNLQKKKGSAAKEPAKEASEEPPLLSTVLVRKAYLRRSKGRDFFSTARAITAKPQKEAEEATKTQPPKWVKADKSKKEVKKGGRWAVDKPKEPKERHTKPIKPPPTLIDDSVAPQTPQPPPADPQLDMGTSDVWSQVLDVELSDRLKRAKSQARSHRSSESPFEQEEEIGAGDPASYKKAPPAYVGENKDVNEGGGDFCKGAIGEEFDEESIDSEKYEAGDGSRRNFDARLDAAPFDPSLDDADAESCGFQTDTYRSTDNEDHGNESDTYVGASERTENSPAGNRATDHDEPLVGILIFCRPDDAFVQDLFRKRKISHCKTNVVLQMDGVNEDSTTGPRLCQNQFRFDMVAVVEADDCRGVAVNYGDNEAGKQSGLAGQENHDKNELSPNYWNGQADENGDYPYETKEDSLEYVTDEDDYDSYEEVDEPYESPRSKSV